MSKRLTAAEREEKGARAYELSARSWSNQAIADEVEVNRNTVSRLLREERKRRQDAREHAAEDSVATYEAVKRHAWERLAAPELKASSYSVSGLLNNIIAAQKNIDGVLGLDTGDAAGTTVNVGVNVRVPDQEERREQFASLHEQIQAYRQGHDDASRNEATEQQPENPA